MSNAIAIHNKHDEEGKLILDTEGKKFLQTKGTNNNHHVEFYKDENGKTQDVMVSFFEAVEKDGDKDYPQWIDSTNKMKDGNSYSA